MSFPRKALTISWAALAAVTMPGCDDENGGIQIAPSAPPFAMLYESGSGQTVASGSKVFLRVKVLSAASQPVEFAYVQWTLLQGNGTIEPDYPGTAGDGHPKGASGLDGIAKAEWTVPMTPGSYNATATLPVKPSETVAFQVTVVSAGVFDRITISPTNPTIVVGSSRQLEVEYRDAGGVLMNAPPGGSVAWSSQGTSATVTSLGLVAPVTPVILGADTITAVFTAPGISKSAKTTVTVVAQQATSVLIVPGTAMVALGTPATPFTASLRDQNGNPMLGGPFNFTWQSLNTNIATIGAVTGEITGIVLGGPVTIRAISDGNVSVFGDAQVTITTSALLPVPLAYAIANQPFAGSYTADPATQFNGMGGPISVVRSGTGLYTVTIPGVGTGVTAALPLVHAVSATSVTCVAVSWTIVGGTNATIRVDCTTPAGAPVDAPFTVFAIGQGGIPGRLAFGHSGPASSLPLPLVTKTLNPAESWSSQGGGTTPQLTRNFSSSLPGRFNFDSRIPLAVGQKFFGIALPAGGGTPRCIQGTFGGFPLLDVICYSPGGTVRADASFSGLLLEGGRTGLRFGAATSNDPAASQNSSGGTIVVNNSTTGTYQVIFGGLGPAGGKETVLVSVLGEGFPNFTCIPSQQWTRAAGNLLVDIRCFNSAGALANANFVMVVIE